MSDVKIKECFSLPVAWNGEYNVNDRYGDILISAVDDTVNMQVIAEAINSYDDNQELIAKLQADNEELRAALKGAMYDRVNDICKSLEGY